MDTTYINYDVKQAERISYKIINPYYSKYCAVHANSNENLKGISKLLQLKNKDILLTGSSADQYLTFVLAGAKTSVIYDINLLAKYNIYLKIGAIKALNYDDFIKFIIPNNKNYMQYFKRTTIKKD